ncbi:MAG: hypothetical protein AAFQ32_15595 [Pseudomonadota bacterium]
MLPRCAALALLLCAGCATIPDIDDAVVAAPVNCETARRDLIALEQMRPTRERAMMVVLSTLTPGGLLSGMVTNDMADRGRIFDGSFAREVNAKKRAIRETCNLNRAIDPVTPTRPEARDPDRIEPQLAPPDDVGEALDPFRTYSNG